MTATPSITRRLACVLAAALLSSGAPGFSQAPPPERSSALQQGFSRLAEGRNRQALQIFQDLLEQPGDGCGECFKGLGQALFRSTKIPLPWTPEEVLKGGRAHRTAIENLEAAQEALRSAMTLTEDWDEALRRELMEVRGWLSAVGVSSDGAYDLVDEPEVRGERLLEQGRLDEAVETLEAQLHHEESSPDAHYNLALALDRSGRPLEAIAAYRRAVDLAPHHGPALNNLANALRAQGRHTEAIEIYERLLELEPDLAGAASNLSSAYREANDLPAAIRAARRALILNAADLAALHNLARSLDELGAVEEAVDAYRLANEVQPSPNLFNDLGIALRRLDRIDEATDAFLRALELAPRNVAAYSNLGGVLRKQGRLSQAAQAYRSAIELAPTNAVLYANLAMVLHEQGELEASADARRLATELWSPARPPVAEQR